MRITLRIFITRSAKFKYYHEDSLPKNIFALLFVKCENIQTFANNSKTAAAK